MKTIAIKMADGSVEIMTLISGTPEEAIAKWHPEKSAKVTSFREVARAEIPQDRSFRNAWVDTGSIQVDMPKAREIVRNLLGGVDDPRIEAAQTPEELLQIKIVRST